MKTRMTIEYELPWPEGTTWQQLREAEEEAWMTGGIAIPDLRSAAMKFELVAGPPAMLER